MHSAKKVLGRFQNQIFPPILCIRQLKSISGEVDKINVLFSLIPNLKESGGKLQSSNHLNKDRFSLENCKASHLTVSSKA